MSAATPWSRFVLPLQYAASVTGAPLVAGRLYFYASGTSTPLDTFSDENLSIPNTNPVAANQDGLFPSIFLSQLEYKVVLTDSTGAEIYTADPVAPFIASESGAGETIVIELTVDGGGSVPTPGVVGDLYVPFSCTINSVVLQATSTGSAVIDVWAAPFVVNTPPNAGNSITAGDQPTLSDAQSNIDTVLTGWDTEIDAGTALRFNLVSVDSLSRITLSLVATRT